MKIRIPNSLSRILNFGTFVCLLIPMFFQDTAQAQWPKITLSRDSSPISYEVYGTGEQVLIFVHGWNCDSRYWRAQIPHFSGRYRMVLLDLAGHGHSGSDRSRYTMAAFGEDVATVVRAMGTSKVILIGHSMGGTVIAHAARLIPDRVAGLIGVDTLENIEYPMTREELDRMKAPLKKDFKAGCRQFIKQMSYPDSDPVLLEWIISDMSSARPDAALSALEEMMSQYITGQAAAVFHEIKVPVILVNGDMWPVNYDANRRHMASFDAIVIKGGDHFLMMNRPDDFNPALEKAIHMILNREKP